MLKLKTEQTRALKTSPWFDYYHIHPSLIGGKARSIPQYLKLIKRMIGLASPRCQRIQAFLLLNMADWRDDLVCLHTPNDNGTQWPLEIRKGYLSRFHFREDERMVSRLTKLGLRSYKVAGAPCVVGFVREA